MKYYLLNLAVHVAITIVLIAVTLFLFDRNRKRRTKYPVTYFAASVMAVVTVVYMFCFSGPRMLDLSDVATQDYYSYTGTIDDISIFNNAIEMDGEIYYINPLRKLPEEGTKVRIRYTRYSRYVISVDVIEDVDVTAAINEEMETQSSVSE